MSQKNKIAKASKHQITYFASANGGDGFRSYFDRIFDSDSFERVYVLKGGPGTGKSTFMKKLLQTAEECGKDTERILCSSDPDSLDGIIINSNDSKIAVLDGTSPHAREANVPGAVDEIIDLGAFFDNDNLTKRKKEIIDLQKNKSERYKTAYSILNCAMTYLRRKQEVLTECIITSKLDAAINRKLNNKTVKEPYPENKVMLNNAISAKGPYSCKTYESAFKNTVPVYGIHGEGFAVLNAIRSFADAKGLSTIQSPTPLDPNVLDAIYINSAEISFFDFGKYRSKNATKQINAQRFMDGDKIKKHRSELRILSRLYNEAMKDAFGFLNETRTYHFMLENIYSQAVSFKEIDKLTKQICDKIKVSCV